MLTLGIEITEPKVAKYMAQRSKPPSQTWRTFLDNHVKIMVSVDFFHCATSKPEQYVAGLTDFGPSRSKLFGNSADKYLKVHNWSDPNHVVITTTDSNTWGGVSGHTYSFTSRPDGLTDIDVVVVREGKNFKRRLLGIVLGTVAQAF